MSRKSLFPILFNGKTYFRKDCNPIFLDFYTCEESLCESCCVYMSDDIFIYPDGSMSSFD